MSELNYKGLYIIIKSVSICDLKYLDKYNSSKKPWDYLERKYDNYILNIDKDKLKEKKLVFPSVPFLWLLILRLLHKRPPIELMLLVKMTSCFMIHMISLFMRT